MSIDHAAKALQLMGLENEWTIASATADAQHLANVAAAQMHATLALAEQQRITNLLAAAALVPDAPKRVMSAIDGWAQDSAADIHSALADDSTWIALLGYRVARERGLAS